VLELVSTSVLTVFRELRRKAMKGAFVKSSDKSFYNETCP
jgi:hypothetical protein